jgi:hypothetical protein
MLQAVGMGLELFKSLTLKKNQGGCRVCRREEGAEAWALSFNLILLVLLYK